MTLMKVVQWNQISTCYIIWHSLVLKFYYKIILNVFNFPFHSHLTIRNSVSQLACLKMVPFPFLWLVFHAMPWAFMADKTVQQHQSVAIQHQHDHRDHGMISEDRMMPTKFKYQKCEFLFIWFMKSPRLSKFFSLL